MGTEGAEDNGQCAVKGAEYEENFHGRYVTRLQACAQHVTGENKKPLEGGAFCGRRYAAMALRSFLMALFSNWRIRSADTPYSFARSCRVDF